MPRVSVVMAVHNGGGYVRAAIESVLRQTFVDFEFVIVDDASTDDTRDVVRSYSDPRICLVQNERNCGQTRSLNRGLALATGEFIARQDADDLSDPERLARQVAFLDAHPDVAMVGTWYRKIDADGRSLGTRRLPCDSSEIRWTLLFFTPFVHTAVMFRRSVVAEVGPYNEARIYSQDHELWSRIAAVRAVANLPEVLVSYRVHSASMTSTYGDIVERESRIRVVAMSQLLGWPDTGDPAEHNRRFDAMRVLLFETKAVTIPSRLPAAVNDIEQLCMIFARRYALGHAASVAHRTTMRRRVSERLIRAAAGCARQDDWLTALRLVLLGIRLRRRVLIDRGLWLAGARGLLDRGLSVINPQHRQRRHGSSDQ